MTTYIKVNQAVASEKDGYLEFIISLSAPSSSQVSVNYNTSYDTASSGNDYGSNSGTLVFAPGVTTQTVRISVVDDKTIESTELFQFNLNNPVNAVITKNSMATIYDNETPADASNKASITVHDVVVDETAGTASFVISLDKATSTSFSVAYSTANGSALAGSDFTAASGSIGFAAGETSKTVTINISDDSTPESDEFFFLNLSSVTGNSANSVQIADGTGQALIGHNDQTSVALPAITASNAVASEKDGYIDFIVSLSAPSASQVSVNYFTSYDTASSGNDYGSNSGTLVFAPGVTTQTVRVAIADDKIVESTELFQFNLSNPVSAVIAKTGMATIYDNDTSADTSNKANLSVRDVIVDESAGTATFVISLDKAASDSFSVAYSTTNGSALAGSDYTSASGSVGFAPGETVKTVTINLLNDTTTEPDELFYLNLTAVSGNATNSVQIAGATAQALIGHNDQTSVALPAITARNASASEKDGYIDFIVSLSAPSTSQVMVNYYTSYDTASSGNDYGSNSGTLIFAPGVTTQTVRVSVAEDKTVESTELFQFNLSNPVNAVIAKTGMGTIYDNDTTADSVNIANLSVHDVVVDENAGTARFVISLDKAASDSFSVAYSTANGSAQAGSTLEGNDYVAASGTIGFAAGETSKTVTININHDNTPEGNEFFFLNLSNLSGNAISSVQIADGTAQAMIGRNDQTVVSTPAITASNAVASEIAGYIDFIVSLSAPSSSQVSVNYYTSYDTASSGNDYGSNSGTLVFTPGVTTQTVRVSVADDKTVESSELFQFNLSNPVNAVIAKTGMGTIYDNDTTADPISKASLSVHDVVVDETSGIATFFISLDKATSDSFSVTYSTSNGSALAGSDFTAVNGTMVFAAGETVKTVSVNIFDDSATELDELFTLSLGAINGNAANSVQIGDATGQAIIGRSDQPTVSTPTISVDNPVSSEKDGYLDFTISLSSASNSQVRVNYSTSYDTASSGNDFGSNSGTLVFAPGVTTQTVRISIVDDKTVESTESFKLNLSNPVNALIGKNGTGSIIDNDTMADTSNKASLSVRDISVDENAGTATFVVTLDKATSDSFSVAYSTLSDTATDGSDFISSSGSIGFASGETAKSVTISIINDPWFENLESFKFQLGAVSGNAASQVQTPSVTASASINSDDIKNPVNPSYSVSTFSGSDDSGNTVIFKLSTTGLAAGTQLGYQISGNSPTLEAQYGMVTIDNNGQSSVSLHPTGNTNGSGNLIFSLTDATVSSNILSGTNAADKLSGSTGSDVFFGGTGNDTIDGGAGVDSALFAGKLADYQLKKAGAGYSVAAKTGTDGTDTLTSIETLKFADMSVNLGIQALAHDAPAANVTRLMELYVAFFNRVPDADGLAYWISQMNAGQKINSIAESFYNAGVQFSSVTGFSANMTNQAFVNVIYKNVLGRADGGDAEGVAYWSGKLADGSATHGSLASTMLDSAHGFKGNTSSGFAWVADLLDNKITLAKTIAVDWGISYNSAEASISNGVAIAAAVTATDINAALKLIGISASDVVLG